MFKSWRSEKKKIKAVFMLQFQATQVPPLKKPALTISLVPEDVGKTTFKLEKAAVLDGTCSWDNPIYVSVKFMREPKSGKLKEKIYHFVVSNGSAKSGYLGEASIDFSDFEEEIEPLTVSLPLKFANSGAVLHVTILKVQGGHEQRKVDANQDSKLESEKSFKDQPGYGNDDSCTENADQDGSFDASIGSAILLRSTLGENSMPRKETIDTIKTKSCLHQRSGTGWSIGSNSDESLMDSTNSPEDNLPIDFRDASDESIQELKSQICSLTRQLEISELELQTLRKQIMKESRKGQDLSREIIDLKSERDALRIECQKLKSSPKCEDDRQFLDKLLVENEDFKIRLEEIERELSHEKELKADLRLQLEKTQDSNSELILAVSDLDEMLRQKNEEIASLSGKITVIKSVSGLQEGECKCHLKGDEDRQPPPPSEMGKNYASELQLLQQKTIDMSDEIEAHRENKLKLESYIEELTSDYQVLKQENRDISSKLETSQLVELKTKTEFSEALATINELELQIETLEGKIEKQTQEFSLALSSINELESQVKGLEKDLEKQAQGFEQDLDAMTRVKIEQEQRAIRAEEALRKTRWQNAIRAERLQEEFKRLSEDMACRFDENEKRTSKAISESNELQVQKRILEETIQRANEELALIKDQNRVKLEELSAKLDLKTKHSQKMSLELEDKSMQLASAMKQREEIQETLSLEIRTLKAIIETLRKENINGISEEKKEKISFQETKTKSESCGSLKDGVETTIETPLSKTQSLEAQNTESTRRILEKEQEKEKLHKQAVQYGRVSSEQESDVNTLLTMDENSSTDLLTGMAMLRERNKVMETELKEMQERYSEISLRFAEVEGERQQLVMTVRNLKNSKKN